MRNTDDLIARLKRPGACLRVTSILVQDAKLLPTPEQGSVRRVVDVNSDAVYLDNGKMMPIGCVGDYQFDGSPDSFRVAVGVATLCYEIAEGAA